MRNIPKMRRTKSCPADIRALIKVYEQRTQFAMIRERATFARLAERAEEQRQAGHESQTTSPDAVCQFKMDG
jgi:hypothetical protein